MYSALCVIRNSITNCCINCYIKSGIKQRLQKFPCLNVQLKRCFQKSSDTAKEVTNGTTVYSFQSDRFYKILTIFGAFQTVFWFNLASLISDIPVNNSRNNLGFIADLQQKHKYKFAGTGYLLGGLVLFFTILYPLRSVKKLVLLNKHQLIDVSTYSFFGRTRSFKVPIEDVSCSLSRDARGSNLSMKIKGKPFFFLIDKNSGIFHDTHLFDHVVGLNRSFK